MKGNSFLGVVKQKAAAQSTTPIVIPHDNLPLQHYRLHYDKPMQIAGCYRYCLKNHFDITDLCNMYASIFCK